MELLNIKTSKLIPYEKNPRKNDEAAEMVANSIREFGFKVPIVIDKNFVVVCGHTRLKAAKKLNIREVPCIMADDLNDEQIKAFRLADNKVSESAEWDFDLLDEELDDLLNFDMEQFGFTYKDEDYDSGEEEEDRDSRFRTSDAYNLLDVDLNRCVGKWQMPYIRKEMHVPKDVMSFNYMLNTDSFEKGIHFYIDDYQFERIWNDPYKYFERLAKFDCAFTPDFSLYTDMPLPMQMWNVFRSRLIGQMMQDNGVRVIPTLSWCMPNSFEFCFDGIEKGGVVSVSTIGVKKDKAAERIWVAGMNEAIRRLEPSHIVVYGGDIGYEFGCGVTYIENHNTERMKDL